MTVINFLHPLSLNMSYSHDCVNTAIYCEVVAVWYVCVWWVCLCLCVCVFVSITFHKSKHVYSDTRFKTQVLYIITWYTGSQHHSSQSKIPAFSHIIILLRFKSMTYNFKHKFTPLQLTIHHRHIVIVSIETQVL